MNYETIDMLVVKSGSLSLSAVFLTFPMPKCRTVGDNAFLLRLKSEHTTGLVSILK